MTSDLERYRLASLTTQQRGALTPYCIALISLISLAKLLIYNGKAWVKVYLK